jgi:hypothetical protein
MNLRSSIKLGLKIFTAAVVLVVVAGIAAPKFQASQYRDKIRDAMQLALNRKVEIGEIRYNVFTGPGFSVTNVTIAEDPELGAEPIAYVNSVGALTAVPRLWSLFTGHLEFASLRMEDAQINLTRSEPQPGQYRWNVERLMRPSIIAAFPNISIRNSRINFKTGDLKSTVYLLDCDLDITPPSGGSDGWHVRFEGKPARTDRPARGSGLFTAKGVWYNSAGKLDLDLQLDRSEVSDIVSLIRGEDAGLQGIVSGKAHLAGPTSAIGISGRLNIAELHGWDQSVPQGEVWPLNLHEAAVGGFGQHAELRGGTAGQCSTASWRSAAAGSEAPGPARRRHRIQRQAQRRGNSPQWAALDSRFTAGAVGSGAGDDY